MECTDPAVYPPDPEVREEWLWRHSLGEEFPAAEAIRAHQRSCAVCRSEMDQIGRVAGALKGGPGPRILAVCPPPERLSEYAAGISSDPRLARHIGVCPLCRDEVAWLRSTSEPRVLPFPSRRAWLLGAVAAAALLALVPTVLHQPEPGLSLFTDLVQPIALERKAILDDVRNPILNPFAEAALSALEQGNAMAAESEAQRLLAADPDNPGGLTLLGLARQKRGDIQGAYRIVLRAEEVRPASEFRCWVLLQLALATGDVESIRRECRHLQFHETHRERAIELMEEVEERLAGRARV